MNALPPCPRCGSEFTYEDYDSHDTVVCVKVVPSAMARQLERDLARTEEARKEAVALAERLRYAIPAGCSEATEI